MIIRALLVLMTCLFIIAALIAYDATAAQYCAETRARVSNAVMAKPPTVHLHMKRQADGAVQFQFDHNPNLTVIYPVWCVDRTPLQVATVPAWGSAGR